MQLFIHHSIARGYRALVLSLSLPFFLITGVTYHCQAQKTIHILKLRNARQLHQFFHYTGNDIPLVSGHRGGMTDRSEEHTSELQSLMRLYYAVFRLKTKILKTK